MPAIQHAACIHIYCSMYTLHSMHMLSACIHIHCSIYTLHGMHMLTACIHIHCSIYTLHGMHMLTLTSTHTSTQYLPDCMHSICLLAVHAFHDDVSSFVPCISAAAPADMPLFVPSLCLLNVVIQPFIHSCVSSFMFASLFIHPRPVWSEVSCDHCKPNMCSMSVHAMVDVRVWVL